MINKKKYAQTLSASTRSSTLPTARTKAVELMKRKVSKPNFPATGLWLWADGSPILWPDGQQMIY